MEADGLTYKILLSNGFKETENGVYECFLQADHRLYMYYNYLESRWSVWCSCGGVKQHLGYCKTVERLNKLLQENNIDKEIIMSKTEEMTQEEYREITIQKIADMLRNTPFTFEFKSVKNPKGIKVIYEVTQEELDAAIRKVHKLKNNEV